MIKFFFRLLQSRTKRNLSHGRRKLWRYRCCTDWSHPCIYSKPFSFHTGSSEIMVKEESPVSYQFVQMGADTNRVQLQALPAATNVVGTSTSAATSTVQPAQCQYYVIGNLNNYTSSAPFKIAPKVAGQTNARSPAAIQIVQSQPVKKRDDRRRATHNEVERRRRDKINHWIMKLGSIIPANGLMPASGATDESGAECSNSTATSDIQSKGGILSKACEYIPMLQENIKK